MQGAEMEDEGSVLKYMTKSEIEEQRLSSLLIMTQRLHCIFIKLCRYYRSRPKLDIQLVIDTIMCFDFNFFTP